MLTDPNLQPPQETPPPEVPSSGEKTVEPGTSGLVSQQPAEQPKQVEVETPTPELPKQPSRDDVLQQYVAKDDLPNDERVLNAIKAGNVDLDTAVRRYKIIKSKLPYMDKEGKVVEAPGLSSKGYQPEMVSQDELAVTDVIKDAAKKAWDKNAYVAQKYASGLSFGMYDPKIDAPDKTTAFIGSMANLAGWGLSSMAGGAAIGAATKGLESVKYCSDSPAIGAGATSGSSGICLASSGVPLII